VSTPSLCIGADDAMELVELLTFIADICESSQDSIDCALGHFLGVGGYGTRELRGDVVRLADVVAKALGFTDSQMDEVP
jgi:hypothetical protein